MRTVFYTALAGLLGGLLLGFAPQGVTADLLGAFAGFFAVLLVRPANRAGDIAVGGACGLIVTLTALLLSGGAGSPHGLEEDVALLSQEAERAATAAALPNPVDKAAGDKPSARLARRYPDLERWNPTRCVRFLADKIKADMGPQLAEANRHHVLMMMLLIPCCFATALYAGRLRREYPPAHLRHACFALLVLLVILALELLLRSAKPAEPYDWLPEDLSQVGDLELLLRSARHAWWPEVICSLAEGVAWGVLLTPLIMIVLRDRTIRPVAILLALLGFTHYVGLGLWISLSRESVDPEQWGYRYLMAGSVFFFALGILVPLLFGRNQRVAPG
jgi:uncharacterized membrane protein YfcA